MKRSPKYLISQKAIRDIDQIWEYSQLSWSRAQADKYYKLLFNQIKNLALHPDLGKSYNSIGIPYRGLVVKSHIIFYRLENEQVIIIRILHKNMDVKLMLDF